MSETESFEEWLSQLQALFAKAGWPGTYVNDCGKDAWVGMFVDGMTPEEALGEEMHAAAQSM